MISVMKDMIRDRGYVANNTTVESDERMGPYIGQQDNLVILIARNFVNRNPFGANTSALTKKDISNFTFDYYRSIQEDILEFATIIVMPSNTLDASIFEDDISVYGTTTFTEEELMFNPTCNVLVPKHCLASDAELKEMEEKKISGDHLPKMYAEDRICKWYGFKKGSIVRIERDYCDEVYYRIVV